MFIATLVLAAVTAGLAIAAFVQIVTGKEAIQAAINSAKATADLAKAATDHAGHANRAIQSSERFSRQELRAYVSAVWGHANYQRTDHPFRVQVFTHVFNTGSTPAYEVITEAGYGIFPLPLPDSVPLMTSPSPSGAGMLGPKQGTFINSNISRTLTVDEIREIKHGDSRIYVFGTVRYKDAFEETHLTEYCFAVIWDELGNPVGSEKMPRHNHAD